MLNGLKRKIQNCMIERCVKEYEADLKAQQNAYDAFMLKQEEKLRRTYENKACNLTAKVMTKEEFATRYENDEFKIIQPSHEPNFKELEELKNLLNN